MFNPKASTPKHTHNCARKGCTKEGLYKAPLSHNATTNYAWLCLEHVREHNANWDWLAGCSEADIEEKIRNSTTWERPSWPLNKAPRPYMKPEKTNRTSTPETHPAHIQKAAQILTLKPPFTITKTKEKYRLLAKKYHPDANNGKSFKIEKFYHLQKAFQLMQTYLQKKV